MLGAFWLFQASGLLLPVTGRMAVDPWPTRLTAWCAGAAGGLKLGGAVLFAPATGSRGWCGSHPEARCAVVMMGAVLLFLIAGLLEEELPGRQLILDDAALPGGLGRMQPSAAVLPVERPAMSDAAILPQHQADKLAREVVTPEGVVVHVRLASASAPGQP